MTAFVLLLVLSLTDFLFSGYRAAAGRNALLHKVDYYLKSFWEGFFAGCVGGLLVTGCVVGLAAVEVTVSGASWSYALGELERAAARMVWAYGGFATLLLSVMLLWTYPKRQIRELSVVLILGPCTLVRPLWTVGGAVFAAWDGPPWIVAGCTVAVVVQLGGEVVLNKIQKRRQLRKLRAWLGAEA